MSTNFYFINRYQKENTYLLKNDHHIASMLQIVPYTIFLENKEESVYFILGVATDKNYQRQGMMKKLMNHVLGLPNIKMHKICYKHIILNYIINLDLMKIIFIKSQKLIFDHDISI